MKKCTVAKSKFRKSQITNHKYQINGTSLGFEIYRADFKTKKWFSEPFSIKGNLDVRMLPEILEFMNPIIEGKPAYLEYDEG